jgi:hypothetical protein
MRKEYPVDTWFKNNIRVRHRIIGTLIMFWVAILVIWKAPQYGRDFELGMVGLWLLFVIPITIGRLIWNWKHYEPVSYCSECGSRKCCVEEVDEDEEENPQE